MIGTTQEVENVDLGPDDDEPCMSFAEFKLRARAQLEAHRARLHRELDAHIDQALALQDAQIERMDLLDAGAHLQ